MQKSKRDALPDNVTIRCTYKGRARSGQHGEKIKDCTSKRLAKKVATSSIGKKLGKIAIDNVPWAYEAGVKRVKNKRLTKTLQSDLANSAFDMERTYVW